MSRSSEVLPQDAWHRSRARFLSPCGAISTVMRMSWRVWCSAQSTHQSVQSLSAAALSSSWHSLLDLLGHVCLDPDPGAWSSQPSGYRSCCSSGMLWIRSASPGHSRVP
eukprot:4146254-Pyramimonas_sp.AAC.1